MPLPWTRACPDCAKFLPSSGRCSVCAAGRPPRLRGSEKKRRFMAKMLAGGRITRPFRYRDGRLPRWDQALTLHESGLTYAEIGRRMGITRQGARDAVRYALIRLRLPHPRPPA